MIWALTPIPTSSDLRVLAEIAHVEAIHTKQRRLAAATTWTLAAAP